MLEFFNQETTYLSIIFENKHFRFLCYKDEYNTKISTYVGIFAAEVTYSYVQKTKCNGLIFS